MNIGFIPLRGGSKSIPLKNIKIFCGRPLCYWAIEALQNCNGIDKIVIATDADEIKECVLQFGFNKLEVYNRDTENARDTSSTEAVVLEYIKKHQFEDNDTLVLVQATNPFITSEDLYGAFKLIEYEHLDSLLTCVRTKRFFWKENGTPVNYDYKKRPRRQDFAGELMENGAFYISPIKNIVQSQNRLNGKIGIYEMPEYSAFEIDEADDWIIMEALFRKHILPASAAKNDRQIKLFLSDVDGVLTDAGMYYTESGDELKKFNTHDGMAFQLLRNNGIKTGIITSENTALVERRSKKLKVDFLYQGKEGKNKLEAAREICSSLNIGLQDAAYIGDDLNCVALLEQVGLAACPADAVQTVKNIPGIKLLATKGGNGAVREFVDFLLSR